MSFSIVVSSKDMRERGERSEVNVWERDSLIQAAAGGTWMCYKTSGLTKWNHKHQHQAFSLSFIICSWTPSEAFLSMFIENKQIQVWKVNESLISVQICAFTLFVNEAQCKGSNCCDGPVRVQISTWLQRCGGTFRECGCKPRWAEAMPWRRVGQNSSAVATETDEENYHCSLLLLKEFLQAAEQWGGP